MQDAVDRDRRLDQHMMEQLTGLVVEGVYEYVSYLLSVPEPHVCMIARVLVFFLW